MQNKALVSVAQYTRVDSARLDTSLFHIHSSLIFGHLATLCHSKNTGSVDICISWDNKIRHGRIQGVHLTEEIEGVLQENFIRSLKSEVGANSITSQPTSG
jgi:hypothetical protein